jgi:hypothetical protein
MKEDVKLLLAEKIERRIIELRGLKVMLDKDLAALYSVTTSNLNKTVKRNIARFPSDFMFQLTREEYQTLRFQTGILESGRGQYSKYLPYVFTEQGVAMLSSVLRSPRAVLVNVEIMRAFVRLRRFLSTHKALAEQLKELESRVSGHDEQIQAIFQAIRQLMAPPADAERPVIGFHPVKSSEPKAVRESRARYRRRKSRGRRRPIGTPG